VATLSPLSSHASASIVTQDLPEVEELPKGADRVNGRRPTGEEIDRGIELLNKALDGLITAPFARRHCRGGPIGCVATSHRRRDWYLIEEG
jgi:hypothetical protein